MNHFGATNIITPPDAAPRAPQWLEEGLLHAGNETAIHAQRAYRLHAVNIDQPLLVLPLAGIKRLGYGAERSEIAGGQFVMIHQAACLQVENLPPPAAGQAYRAWALAFPWRVVALARTLLGAHRAPTGRIAVRPFSDGMIEPLRPALHSLLTLLAATAPDPAGVDHALLGVLLALARSGHEQFLCAADPTHSARIRLLVAAAPERDWTSAHFEAALHVSGATLRRRLVAENTSLRTLLREARLHHGLSLLQTGRQPMKSVASACGYRSVPSFTRNFLARFGVEPSAVANF